MKNNIVYFVFLFCFVSATAQTGIGTTTPDASAKLDVYATNKGFLLPRMTLAQRGLISSPANGLLVYQTDGDAGFYVNTGTPVASVWTRVNMDWTRTGNNISYTAGNVSTTGSLTGGNLATSKLSGFVSNTSTEASSRTLTVADNGMILKCSAAITLTLPSGTLPEGFNCMVLQQSTGQISFSGTFSNRNSFTKSAGQYSIVTILYIGGVYIVTGEMSN